MTPADRTMRGAVLAGPRRIVIEERPVPAPTDGQVLVRIEQVGICGGDLHAFRGRPYASVPPRPVILGHEGAGTIEASSAPDLPVGARVVFDPQIWCGRCEQCLLGRQELCRDRQDMGVAVDGAFAEFAVVRVEQCYRVPDPLTWDQAVSVIALAAPIHACETVPHAVGETVAVLGAGPAGLFFVQLEKSCYGARRVIVAGRSRTRLDLAKRLGADASVNTREEDLVDAVQRITGGRGVDLVIETTGDGPLRLAVPRLLADRGRVLAFAGSQMPIGFDFRKEMSVFGSTGAAHGMSPALAFIESGRIRVDGIISHHFPLDRIQTAFELATADVKDEFVKGVIDVS